MTVTVEQSKLVLNAFSAIFQNNLLAADLVTWKKYDSEMNDRNGLTVVEQVPPRYNVTTTENGIKDLTAGVQSTVFGSEMYNINRTFGSSMGWGDFVKIRDLGEARESEAIKAAATNLAEAIDAHILRFCALASNNWLGTPGLAVDSFGDFMAGYTRLKEEGVEDTDLRAVLTYGDKQALGEEVIQMAAPDAMVTQSFRGGFTGEVGGIPTLFTQQLPTLIMGTRTNGAINGAAQNVNYADVARASAPGRYLSQVIAIDGIGGGTQTIKAGEVFTIAGVYAYDNRLGAQLDHLQQFTVLEDAVAVAGAVAALRIFPALVAPTGNDVNIAHATVSAAPADNAVVTFMGTSGQAVRPRLLMNKGAVVVNTADLIMPASGSASRKQLTKVPLSVRMWQDSTFETGEHRVRFDVALTANVRDRRRLVRINGAA
jgi:hypothetical protein